MVLPCESLFSRTSLDGRPLNLHTFSKVNLKYTKHTFPVGQRRCSFHLPHSYNLQILLARGNRASTNVEPCLLLVFCRIQLQRGKWLCCTMGAQMPWWLRPLCICFINLHIFSLILASEWHLLLYFYWNTPGARGRRETPLRGSK